MPALIRTLAFCGAILCFSLVAVAIPAEAATHKKTHHSKKHVTKGKAVSDTKLRDVQTHLTNLEYYKGKVDGLNGPKTRAAIKNFQHDHSLPATGKLNLQTFDAIVQADKEHDLSSLPPMTAPVIAPPAPRVVDTAPMPPETLPATGPDFYETHPDFYGHYHQAFDNPLLLGPSQTLASRFAKVDMTEDTPQNGARRFNVSLNGLPLILVDGQPSVVGVSKTYDMGDEDVIIFTSFKDHDPVCAWAYNLLILSADGTKSREITNCSRGYQAKVDNGSLFVTFPNPEDPRALGSVWRYQKGDLEKL